jgi:hypothetical protein
MSYFLRRAAFSLPFDVRIVGEEVLVTSEQAPVELVFTEECARIMADRLLKASEAIANTRIVGGMGQTRGDST